MKKTERRLTTRSVWFWFQEFFDDNSSGASTTRALNWIWTGTLCFSILFIIGIEGYLAIKKGDPSILKLPEIASAYLMITSAYLAAKVGQRIWGEQDSGSSTTTLQLPSGSFISTYTSQPIYTPGQPVTYVTNQVSGSLPVSGSNP